MSVYPRNLSTFLNRLSGYNKNNVKMNVLGSTKANQGDVIQVDLPTNSIVDLSSLAWSFDAKYTCTGANTKKHHLPINAESLISRLAVEVNGQTLVNLTNYNTLYHALLYMTATEDYQRQRMVAQANIQGGGVKKANGDAGDAVVNGTVQELTSLDAGGANTQVTTRRHVIDTWLGFLGSAKPNFIDTSLLGNVRITITLANGDIVGGDDAGSSSVFEVDKQHFSVDVVSISDGVYDAMVDQMLASGAPIEIPFKNYFSFASTQTSMAQTTAFNVASQSIDRMWAIARQTGAAGVGAEGYNKSEATKITTAPPHPIVVDNPAYFNYSTCNGTGFHFQVNNTLYPQWTSDNPQDFWQHTKLAVGDQGNMLAGAYPAALSHYMDNFFVYACELQHRTDGDERYISGIDTRGAAAQCYFNSTQSPATDDLDTSHALRNRAGTAVPNQILVWAECTSSLRIMANKVVEIVQ